MHVGGKSDGEGDPFPIFNAPIVTLAPSGKSSCVADGETKLGQKLLRLREGRFEIVHFNGRQRPPPSLPVMPLFSLSVVKFYCLILPLYFRSLIKSAMTKGFQ